MKTLVIDVGGTHVKLLATGRRTPLKLPSGPDLTPAAMVASVRDATAEWHFDRASIGYPGPVANNAPSKEPTNCGAGWVGYDFAAALGCPVRLVNDAAMQALGSYDGGTMLFLGLGTGLGSTLVRDGLLVPLELAHLPYRHGKTYEQYLGEAAIERLGKKKWRRHVGIVTALFLAAFNADYAVLGGGNTRMLEELPPGARRGSNANAFSGGYRLWSELRA